ncbi:MAG TPA: MurT ligase domain-containing protein [Acidimicrobiales bacterium]|nr:MurT ligase domain-containing protein [Acidimicrobiales bacterium]
MTISKSSSSSPAADLTLRASTAIHTASAINGLSRLFGRGSGTVIGGRAGLAMDPHLLATLAQGRLVGLVSGTNGKTTTTRLLAAAVKAGGLSVATNTTGSNMPPGHVAALIGTQSTAAAVLEVDESYLGQLIEDTRPAVVLLLNLSRDQLDRIAEVRILADRWRQALVALDEDALTQVVANADDPMVAWAATAARNVRWVGAGQVWREDAVGCPACGGRIKFEESGAWACDTCEFRRPMCRAWLEGTELVLADGSRHQVSLGVPGQFNRANAAMVVTALPCMDDRWDGGPGRTVDDALAAMAAVEEVAGRFSTVVRGGVDVRLLLAKNPAGWTALFDLLDESGGAALPTVLSVNARIADGLDTSWLWDVPFERLRGRTVVATGERCRDLAVRLRYAEVAHTVVPDPVAALDVAIQGTTGTQVEFVGNYTAFAVLRGRL